MDVNCDLGEAAGNDHMIMPYLGSCNIACGGHAGDKISMVNTLRMAKKYGVKVGAHPSFDDRENFGRKEIYVPAEVLRSQLIHQIAELNELAKTEGMKLNHVKAHGALYNMASTSSEYAMALIKAVQFFNEELFLYVPFESMLENKARLNGVPIKVELFADRNYNDDLTLVSRSSENAVIEDPSLVKKKVALMLNEKKLVSVNGKKITIDFDTICIHGDNPKAVEIAKELSSIKDTNS